MPLPNLIFIDTNIWLDFYRARTETGLKLLNHVESISDRLIVTYQLESEFKRNRQAAILDGMQELKPPQQISRPGIFSDSKATQLMGKSLRDVEKRVKNLRGRLVRALENPAVQDPIYKVCQRIFHKNDDLTLNRENPLRRIVRRKAFRRFIHGYPPRKRNDTSIGDAFNWEWMIDCVTRRKAGLVLVSRDSDYGVTIDGKSYINDHLKQEFSERVSQKRKLLLFSRLSDALKLFAISVSQQEEEAESELVSDSTQRTASELNAELLRVIESISSLVPETPRIPQATNERLKESLKANLKARISEASKAAGTGKTPPGSSS